MTAIDVEVEAQAVAASQGDRDALGALYAKYADPLFRFIVTRVNNDRLLAEDLAANTWEKVAKSIRSYETKGAGFPAWLFTIGRHAICENGRLLMRSKEQLHGDMLTLDFPDTAAAADQIVERRMDAFQLAAAVRGLSPQQRRCVTLRFYVGLSLNDTAAVMGKKSNAVKQLQHRALTTLAERVGVTRQVTGQEVETFLPTALEVESGEEWHGGAGIAGDEAKAS